MLTLNYMEELDDNTLLFTVDAAAMCPNINTEEGLMFLTISLDNLIFKVDSSWPRKEIINTTKMFLRFNVYQFGNTCYRQKEGGEIASPFS